MPMLQHSNQKLDKEKVKEKGDTSYKDNDSKIGTTGSTTENNEKINTQNEEQDRKQIEKRERLRKGKKTKREIRIQNQKYVKDAKNMRKQGYIVKNAIVGIIMNVKKQRRNK